MDMCQEDLHRQNCKMFNDIWMKDALIRYENMKQKEINKNKCPYIFLTINPNPNVTIGEFVKVITRMMSKTWIVNYLYVYEQRGEDEGECGKGFHFHAIIKKPDNLVPSHIQRELASSIKKVCDTSCIHFFNIKNISEEEKDRKIIYITGSKADEQKHLKQQMDIPFRNNNDLKSFYNVGII